MVIWMNEPNRALQCRIVLSIASENVLWLGEVWDPWDGSSAPASEQRDPASVEAGQRRCRLRTTRGSYESPYHSFFLLWNNTRKLHFFGYVFDFSLSLSLGFLSLTWFSSQVPEQHEKTLKYVKWRYYLGLGIYIQPPIHIILMIIDKWSLICKISLS